MCLDVQRTVQTNIVSSSAAGVSRVIHSCLQEVQEGVSAAFTRPLAVDATQQGEPQISQAALRPDANQSLGGAGQAAAGPRTLWSEAAELAEARERSQWHELMSRRNTEPSEKLQVDE